jgi:PEP-utilising enzyme, PEP-binding domain
VLRLMGMALGAACERGVPAGVGGEAAGEQLARVLVGLGASSLSTSPAALPGVRAALAGATMAACEAAAQAAPGGDERGRRAQGGRGGARAGAHLIAPLRTCPTAARGYAPGILDPRGVLTFAAVARERSFSRAATARRHQDQAARIAQPLAAGAAQGGAPRLRRTTCRPARLGRH